MTYTPGEIRAAETLTSERDDWEDYWHYHAFRDDVKPLCQTILRHRADYDAEGMPLPVDETWCKANGGMFVEPEGASDFWLWEIGPFHVRWYLSGHVALGSTVLNKPTRPQLRALIDILSQ